MKYLIAGILLLLSELVYFKIADLLKIIDRPNVRSAHSNAALRGGGIIFYLGIILYYLMFGFAYPWFFVGLTLITLISFAEDIKPISFKLRLIIHFLSMAILFYQLELFGLPWFLSLILLVFCTGILNAYNFMDGINGITGGYSLVIMGSIWYINTFQVSFVDDNLLYILMLALVVFNLFNFRSNVKCFAGDVGAISIAFIIVFLLGMLIIKTGDFTYIMLLALYGVDTIITIIRRILLKENIFQAHRRHLFQLMANELKMPHLLVSSIYMLLQAIVAVGLIFSSSHYWYSLIVIVLLSATYLIVFKKYNARKPNIIN